MLRKERPVASGASGTVKRRSLSPPVWRKTLFVILFLMWPFRKSSLFHWFVERLWASRPFVTLFDETNSPTDKSIRKWSEAVINESHQHIADVAVVFAGTVVIFATLGLSVHIMGTAKPVEPPVHTTLTWFPIAKPGLDPIKPGGGGGGGERLSIPATRGNLPPPCAKEPCTPPSIHQPRTKPKLFLEGGVRAQVPTRKATAPIGDPEAPEITSSQGPGGGGGIGTGLEGGVGPGIGTGIGPGFVAGINGGPGGRGNGSPFRINWPPGQVCEPPLNYPCPTLGDGLRELINLPKTIVRLDVVVKNKEGEIFPETLKLIALYHVREKGTGNKLVVELVKLEDRELEKRVAKIYMKYWKQWKFPIVFLEENGTITPINGGRFFIDTPPIGKR